MSNTVYEVLRRPLITEKGNLLRDEDNKYVFEVAVDANKSAIRDAVEALFAVRVRGVCTSIVRGKKKRVGRNIGKQANWKKAIVTLYPGDQIELFEGV